MSRALVRDLVAERARKLFGFCGYCGSPCTGTVCAAHVNVAALDPHHQLKCNKEGR